LTANDPVLLENTACTTGTATLNGNSQTLGLPPNLICDSVDVQVFTPGSLAQVSGSMFLDANGNGVHDGDEGPKSGFVFYADYNNSKTLDAGEPAAASAADGTWTIKGIKPGDFTVREAADPNFTCTFPGTGDACSYGVHLSSGASVPVGEFGNFPVP